VAQLRDNADFSVIVNRVAAYGQGIKTFDKLAEVAKRYTGVKLWYLGEIAADPTVTQRRLGQLPLALTDPRSATNQALVAILQNLEKTAGPFEPRRVLPARGLEARFQEHRLFLC
jgi:MinD-like ATPase involved in chromosome partitioning or flagellar assembly